MCACGLLIKGESPSFVTANYGEPRGRGGGGGEKAQPIVHRRMGHPENQSLRPGPPAYRFLSQASTPFIAKQSSLLYVSRVSNT
jgi:hypothetical protein